MKRKKNARQFNFNHKNVSRYHFIKTLAIVCFSFLGDTFHFFSIKYEYETGSH